MPQAILHTYDSNEAAVPVDATNPIPIYDVVTPRFRDAPFSADYMWALAYGGRLFTASDAAAGDLVTGQTSFANTTPTFLLNVPAGTVALPLSVDLAQSGVVAGGAVDVLMEVDRVNRFSTGGVSEKVFSPRPSDVGSQCTLRSGATALAGYGIRVWGATIGQDVSPAEGAVQGPFWKPSIPHFISGPGAFLVFTYAATTGPSWLWSIAWAEWPASELSSVLHGALS